MRMILRSWTAIVVLVALAPQGRTAFAQTAPDASRGPRANASENAVNPVMPPANIGQLIQRSGGSLARAELALRPDGAASPTAAMVSYYSVPEPTPKLLRKHDLVTIVVREDSNFTSEGTTDLKRNADIDAQITNYLQLRLSKLAIIPRAPTLPIEITGTTSRDFKGDATVDRTDSLTANITATVVDVKPNGTLVLQATKEIKTDEEEQKFVLTGMCRVDDISADNTVLSTQLYGMELTKMQKGAVRDTGTRSIIHRLLDEINPF